MEISILKMQMSRPEINPRSCDLHLNIDWHVDYHETEDSSLGYVCTIKTVDKFPITLIVEGNVGFENLEIPKETTQLILDNSMKIMLNMVNITKETITDENTVYNEIVTRKSETDQPKRKSIIIDPCLDC